MSCPNEILSPADLQPLWAEIKKLQKITSDHTNQISFLTEELKKKPSENWVKDFVVSWVLGAGLTRIAKATVAQPVVVATIARLAEEGAANALVPFIRKIDALSANLTTVGKRASAALTTGKEAKAIANTASKNVGIVQKTVGTIQGQVNKVSGAVSGLKSTVASNTQKIIANSKTLTKVSNVANSAFSKAGQLFTKLAPIFGIVGFLVNLASTLGTAYALAQLFSRMTAQEKATAALYTALTFAGGGLLTAVYVKGLEGRVKAIEVRQKVDTNRIISHVTAEHRVTRTGTTAIPAMVRSEHRTTREAINTSRSAVISQVFESRQSNIVEHVNTRKTSSANHRKTRNYFLDMINRLGVSMTGFYTNIMAAIANIGTTINNTALAPINAKLDGVLSAIGSLQTKMLGKFDKLWDFLKMDRVLNAYTAITVTHNAYQVSNALAQTLFAGIGNALAFFGMKDPEGNAFDVSQVVGGGFDSLMKSALGVETWTDIKEEWRSFNRIYQTGANLMWSIQAIGDIGRSLTELAIENTGKIGNALRKAGAVFEKAYEPMAERATAQTATQQKIASFTETLRGFEDKASTLEAVTSDALELTYAVDELKNSRTEFDNVLTEELEIVKEEEETAKNASQSPSISESDIYKSPAEV